MPIDNNLVVAVGVLLTAIAVAIPVLISILRRWSNVRLTRAESDLADARAVSGERLRVEALPAKLDSLKILYIGVNDNDMMQAVTIFQQSGISNRLITMDSPKQGFEYIRDNPAVVLFVIVFVEEIGRGKTFLELVRQDDLTVGIPVFFLNGFEDTGKIMLFEEGLDGLLQKPINMGALLTILNRLGYSSEISKN